MSRRTLGVLASVIGSAIGIWWYSTRERSRGRSRQLTPARDHGTVIFDNTPAPAAPDAF